MVEAAFGVLGNGFHKPGVFGWLSEKHFKSLRGDFATTVAVRLWNSHRYILGRWYRTPKGAIRLTGFDSFALVSRQFVGEGEAGV